MVSACLDYEVRAYDNPRLHKRLTCIREHMTCGQDCGR
jgi:hypothetical protein